MLRCLSSAETGHEFLQYHADQNVADIDVSHFFKALKSPRRLENITSLSDLIASPMTGRVADAYDQCCELDGWDIYTVDGHYHKAARFDPKHEASDGAVRATATGHFFRLNMCTHHLSCLAMAEPEEGKEREHDNGVQLRRIVYINPEDGKTYTCLTNDLTLPANIKI